MEIRPSTPQAIYTMHHGNFFLYMNFEKEQYIFYEENNNHDIRSFIIINNTCVIKTKSCCGLSLKPNPVKCKLVEP